jgi:hypothetical protein
LRRSTRRLAILLLTLSLSAPAADAIQLGRAVALGVGVTWPMQPDQFKEFWNAGVALSAGFMFEPAPRLGVGIEVGYYRHEFDSNAFEAALSDSIPQVSVGGRYSYFIPVTVVAEFDLVRWGVTKPFLRVGAGIYPRRAASLTASGPGAQTLLAQVQQDALDETVFGASGGIGFRTPITPAVDIAFDASYHVAWTEGETTAFLPVRMTLRF